MSIRYQTKIVVSKNESGKRKIKSFQRLFVLLLIFRYRNHYFDTMLRIELHKNSIFHEFALYNYDDYRY